MTKANRKLLGVNPYESRKYDSFYKKSLAKCGINCSSLWAATLPKTRIHEEDAPCLDRLGCHGCGSERGGNRSGAIAILPQEPGAPALGSEPVSIQPDHPG